MNIYALLHKNNSRNSETNHETGEYHLSTLIIDALSQASLDNLSTN